MKKIYFRSVLLAQLCIALILFLCEATPYSVSRYFSFMLYIGLHPIYNMGNGDVIPVLSGLFGLSLFWGAVLCACIWLFFYKLKKKELPRQSWHIISYPQKVLICQALLIISLIAILFIESYYMYSLDLVLISIIIFAGAYFMAFLWHVASQLKDKSRASSIIMGVLSALLFLSFPVVMYFELKEPTNETYSDNDSSGEGVIIINGDEEEYYPEDEEDYIGEWEGPVADDNFIAKSMEYLIDSMEYGNYPWYGIVMLTSPDYISWFNMNKEIDKKLLFANNIGLHINRDNNKLLQFYNRFSDFIYARIPLNIYTESSASDYVSLFIRIYQECSTEYEYLNSELMDQIYRLASGNDNTWEAMNSLLAEYNIAPVYTTEDGADYDRERAYTFWARRYKEGNHDATYIILNNIQEHYNELRRGN